MTVANAVAAAAAVAAPPKSQLQKNLDEARYELSKYFGAGQGKAAVMAVETIVLGLLGKAAEGAAGPIGGALDPFVQMGEQAIENATSDALGRLAPSAAPAPVIVPPVAPAAPAAQGTPTVAPVVANAFAQLASGIGALAGHFGIKL